MNYQETALTSPKEIHEFLCKWIVDRQEPEWESFVSKFQRSAADASAEEKWKIVERIYKLGE